MEKIKKKKILEIRQDKSDQVFYMSIFKFAHRGEEQPRPVSLCVVLVDEKYCRPNMATPNFLSNIEHILSCHDVPILENITVFEN